MPYIDDVAPHTTIRSVWGNTIRDRVILDLASIAERDAKVTAPHDGQVVWTALEHVLWIRYVGRWCVLDMDWAAFPANVWVSSSAPSGAGAPLKASDCAWRNRFGRAAVMATYTIGRATQDPAGNVYVRLPVTSLKPNLLGIATAIHYGNGLTYGGSLVFSAASPVGATSVGVVQAVGNGVPPGAVIPTSVPPGDLAVALNLDYWCDLAAWTAT